MVTDPKLTAEQLAAFHQSLAGLGLSPDQACPTRLDSRDHDGCIRLSWTAARSVLPPARLENNHTACLAAHEIEVHPGHRLVLESPVHEPLKLAVGRLRLHPGSIVEVQTQTNLNASVLEALVPAPESDTPSSSIQVIGYAGDSGTQGGEGCKGSDGASPGDPGGPGGGGATGGAGSAGGPAGDAVFNFHTLSGTLSIVDRGGDGGPGGNGGNGGTGGQGGPGPAGQMGPGGSGGSGGGGGAGGDGGAGSQVLVCFRELAPGAEIRTDTTPARGGTGGAGGPGGPGGLGHPNGLAGGLGGSGANGSPGRPGQVTLRCTQS